MAWSDWTDEEWKTLYAMCREDGIEMPESEIREAAENFMRVGSEGGGNRWGIIGTVIALNTERVEKARANR